MDNVAVDAPSGAYKAIAWLGMAFAAAGVAVANRTSPRTRRLDSGEEEQR